MIQVKRLAEKENNINLFTVEFIGTYIELGNKVLPLGQICTDVMNIDMNEFNKIRDVVVLTAESLLKNLFSSNVEVDAKLALSTVNKLGKIMRLITYFPLYEHLNIRSINDTSTEVSQKTIENLKLAAIKGSPQNKDFCLLLMDCLRVFDDILVFQRVTLTITDFYFDKLKKRNAEGYAVGIYDFLMDKETQIILDKILPPGTNIFSEKDVRIEYVTKPDPHNSEKYCIAERIEFCNIASFLYIEFFRSLMHGRTPRRCQNCGKYFLLENGYNIKYCNNIAPGETKKTCRAIGAHRKEQQKREKSPVEAEYKKAYERLKKQKQNGKISVDEWNEKVSYIQEIKEKVIKGEMDEFAVVEILRKI